MTKFGIEEEFMLLDSRTLSPVPQGSSARAALHKDALQSALAGTAFSGDASAEFLDCQVEISTSPVESVDAAAAELSSFRRTLGEFAERNNLIGSSAATPFGSAYASTVTPKERYQVIAGLMGGLTREHFVNGLHVHTEVIDPEERVHALNAVRPWLPALLALTTNSPFWRRQDSGFASWRSILLRRMPTMWAPPVFHDLDDYESRIDRLVSMGAAVDRASIAWAARISNRYDTVEVRVFDAQLTVDDTLLAAALTRAIIADPPRTKALDSEAIDAALWMASRQGMDAQFLDPQTGDLASAWGVLQRLTDAVAHTLGAHGDNTFVEEGLARVRESGTGAERQRTALTQHGINGLRELLSQN